MPASQDRDQKRVESKSSCVRSELLQRCCQPSFTKNIENASNLLNLRRIWVKFSDYGSYIKDAYGYDDDNDVG